MENNTLDEVGKYNSISFAEDVEDEEMLNRVLQKEEEEVQGIKMQWKI